MRYWFWSESRFDSAINEWYAIHENAAWFWWLLKPWFWWHGSDDCWSQSIESFWNRLLLNGILLFMVDIQTACSTIAMSRNDCISCRTPIRGHNHATNPWPRRVDGCDSLWCSDDPDGFQRFFLYCRIRSEDLDQRLGEFMVYKWAVLQICFRLPQIVHPNRLVKVDLHESYYPIKKHPTAKFYCTLMLSALLARDVWVLLPQKVYYTSFLDHFRTLWRQCTNAVQC